MLVFVSEKIRPLLLEKGVVAVPRLHYHQQALHQPSHISDSGGPWSEQVWPGSGKLD